MREMKDSGIEWIGKIPTSWETRKLFGLLQSIGSGTTPKGEDNYNKNGIPWLNTGDLNDGYISTTSKCVTEIAMNNYSALQMHKAGSIVIAMYGATIGKLGISEMDLTTNQACCVMNPTEFLEKKFLFYTLMAAKDYFLFSSYGAGQPNISQNTIKQLKVPYTDIINQKCICEYLDERCAKIDASIEKQREIIEKLKEYKLSVITEAVTKGLNPDAEMKDSGIDWIGQVNSKYQFAKIGRLCFVTKLAGFEYTNTMVEKISDDEEIPIVRAQNVRMFRFEYETIREFIDVETSNNLQRCALDQRCLLITFIGAGIGDICVFDNPNRYHLAPNVAKIVIHKEHKKDILEEYLMYYIGSFAGKGEIAKISKASAQPSLSMETIRGITIVLPKLEEQKAIVYYLNSKCNKINEIIFSREKIVEKYQEIKKSLIYEVVTGKREV